MSELVNRIVRELKEERSRLDAAINALEPKETKRVVQRKKADRACAVWSADIKRRVVVEMNAAQPGTRASVARELALRMGISFATIQTSWAKWALQMGIAVVTTRLGRPMVATEQVQ